MILWKNSHHFTFFHAKLNEIYCVIASDIDVRIYINILSLKPI